MAKFWAYSLLFFASQDSLYFCNRLGIKQYNHRDQPNKMAIPETSAVRPMMIKGAIENWEKISSTAES